MDLFFHSYNKLFVFVDQRNAIVPLITSLALFDSDAKSKGITWPKSYVEAHFSFLNLRNKMVQLVMLLTWCDNDASTSGIKYQKVKLQLIWIVLIWEIQWCHWQYYHFHMILGLVPIVEHDMKSHVAPYFDHLDIRNAVVSMMVLSTSCDANISEMALHDTNASDIMWCQCFC